MFSSFYHHFETFTVGKNVENNRKLLLRKNSQFLTKETTLKKKKTTTHILSQKNQYDSRYVQKLKKKKKTHKIHRHEA